MAEILKRPPGRPPLNAIEEKIEMPPSADHGRIEGAPAQTIDVTKEVRVAKPVKAEEVEKEHTWHKVYIDLGQSTSHIRVNEMEFHQGQVATVRDDLLPVLNEIMYNTKMHERVVRGDASPSGRRLQGQRN
jgi:hypothetical protein